jgi:hypothetical protein
VDGCPAVSPVSDPGSPAGSTAGSTAVLQNTELAIIFESSIALLLNGHSPQAANALATFPWAVHHLLSELIEKRGETSLANHLESTFFVEVSQNGTPHSLQGAIHSDIQWLQL